MSSWNLLCIKFVDDLHWELVVTQFYMTWGLLSLACFYFKSKSEVPHTWWFMWVCMARLSFCVLLFIIIDALLLTHRCRDKNPPSGCTGQMSACVITTVLAAGFDYFLSNQLLLSLSWVSLWLPCSHWLCVSIIDITDPGTLRCARYVHTLSPALFGCDNSFHCKHLP